MPLPLFPELPRALESLQSTLIALFCLVFVVLPLLWAGFIISFIWIIGQLAEAVRQQEEDVRARRRVNGHPADGSTNWTLEYPLTPPTTHEEREREWAISSLRERAMFAQSHPVTAASFGVEAGGDVRESTGRRVSFRLDEEVEEGRRGRARERRDEQAQGNRDAHRVAYDGVGGNGGAGNRFTLIN